MTPSPRTPIIAHHLLLTGYGHWLPNDPRGSGSSQIRQAKFAELGRIHFGHKRVQPARAELRQFQKAAQPRLDHTVIWFDEDPRQALTNAVGEVVMRRSYTVWACAVLKNHFHLCIRKHRDDAQTMLDMLADETRDALQTAGTIPPDHPLWADRPYKRFLYTPDDMRRVIEYIKGNPEKEGLAPQSWPFVVPYDSWPFHKRGK